MPGKRRVFFSNLSTETNTFSNIPTTYASYEEGGISRGDEIGITADGKWRPEFVAPAEFLAQHNAEFVFGLSADAASGAPTQHRDYLRLRDELLQRLQDAAPVDAVVLSLHGAMISTECLDCEGEVLAGVREVVGAGVPIVSVLDPHAHLTHAMVEPSDFLVFMKEYPHIDGIERHVEALQVIVDMWSGVSAPQTHIENCELIGFFPTQAPPMDGFVQRLFELERREEITSVSFVHGFPWGDHPDLGAKVLVYGNDIAVMQAVSEDLKKTIRSICHSALPDAISIDQAVAEASSDDVPLRIYGDVSDNAGGGAPSDSTFVLRSLVSCDVPPVLVGCLYDPEAVKLCHQVGIGGRLMLRVGGKLSVHSGTPLDLPVEVMALATDVSMDVLGLVKFPLGDTAWVRSGNIDIVLISIREQTYSPHGFSHLGVDFYRYRAIFVKSTNHFRATFKELSESMQNVATPGAINFQLTEIEYERFKGDYLRADISSRPAR